MECPTVRMKCEPTPENPAGFVVINAIDYRPEDGMITVEEFDARVQSARAEAEKQDADAIAKQATENASKAPADTHEAGGPGKAQAPTDGRLSGDDESSKQDSKTKKSK